MGLISKTYTFSAGAVIVAAEHNSNFDTIYNEFNGNIENANIKAGAGISASKLDLSSPSTIGGTTPGAASFSNLAASTFKLPSGTSIVGIVDEDDMASDSASLACTQQSVKAYVDAASGPSCVRAYLTKNQTINNTTYTKVQFGAVNFDNNDEFDTTTNYRFVADADGLYVASTTFLIPNIGDEKTFSASFYVNGSVFSTCLERSSGSVIQGLSFTDIVSLSATNFLEVYVYQSSGGSINLYGNSTCSFFSVSKIKAG